MISRSFACTCLSANNSLTVNVCEIFNILSFICTHLFFFTNNVLFNVDNTSEKETSMLNLMTMR